MCSTVVFCVILLEECVKCSPYPQNKLLAGAIILEGQGHLCHYCRAAVFNLREEWNPMERFHWLEEFQFTYWHKTTENPCRS